MTKTLFKIVWRDEAYGELSGIESAFRVTGETASTLTKAIESVGYKWHPRRACWYTYDRAARLILEDNLAVVCATRSE